MKSCSSVSGASFRLARVVIAIVAIAGALGCGAPPEAEVEEASAATTAAIPENALSEAEVADGWRLLFDGQSLSRMAGVHDGHDSCWLECE